MPLLSRRRSLLDLSKRDAHSDSETTPTKTKPSRANLHPNDHVTSLRPTSAHGQSSSRLSHELRPEDLSDASPDTSGVAQRAKRFSMVKLRNFSESHLSVKAKEADSDDLTPPVPAVVEPAVPSIVRTAPTMDDQIMQGHEEEGEGRASTHMSRSVRHSMFMRSLSKSRDRRTEDKTKATDRKKEKPHSSLRWRRTNKSSGLEELLSVVHDSHNASSAPPSYGDESHSDVALQVPDPRYSDSSRSDCSNNSSSEQIYGQTTTTRTVSTYTTFFKLSRRNKNRDSLFPLPVTIPPPTEKPGSRSGPATPRASTSAISSQESGLETPPTVLQRRRTESSPTHRSGSRPVTSPQAAPPKASLLFHEPTPALLREGSTRSHASSSSSPLQPPMRLGLRGRASTNSSDRHSHDPGTPPQYPGSVRNSTSTAGRPSFGGLLNLTRFRQGSEPHSPRHGSPGTRSKSNSFAISREALVIPEREEGDTPGKYLERLEAAVARSVIAGILSKSSDPFAQAVLRSYTRRFMFFGEPIDMSLRKFLLEAELPKETQQVDRVIQAFADRYHECNPGIFVAPDQAYIIAFSLMMLHTDAFNKNNKRKMQKHDYIKNTSGQYVSDDILACFYDNICYTPFVHYEEEVDINGERVLPFKPKKSKFKGSVTDSAGKKPSGPVDPYNLLVENKLDTLRPSLRDSITLDDPYNYRGSESDFDPAYLQRAFTHTGVLQIISARSRPAAYEGQLGHTNEASTPTETQQGIVDLKITKVGTLWRKAAKKKKARSPWQEWGAVLTGSQLYLFRNTHWAKGLAHQFNSQQKLGHPRIPVIFKPPLQEFKPDALIKTDNAVALVDATYTRHKHAFTFFRTGGQEEVFLAENESEMNDWLALINYAAAFRAAGVRIRGMVGGSEEESKPTHPQRFGSSASTQSSPKSNHDEDSTVSRVVMSPPLQRQVMAARRQIMVSKIAESETEIAATVKRLDEIMRNARHLLILAPIAPRTRDDVIHAAARADATIKWVRRDIWRLKCHRDILAMDVQLDGLTAAEIEKLAEQRMTVIQENSKKEQSSLVARMGSKVGVMRSPPQSPASPTRSARPSTTSSKETFLAKDAFRVSAEPPTPQNEVDAYQIPPLQLDLQHRGSITSAMLSVSSYSRPSLSQASSIASMQPATRLDSNALSDVTSIRPDQALSTPIRGDSEVERLARASTATPETLLATSRTKSTEESSVNATPESARRKGARRSLQRTLREAHGSTHRHRRAKDSESTIRSGAIESDELAEGTPGLQREKGRFILHGKQASVVQLDWSSDQMQQRRETMKSDAPRQSFENNRNSMASRTSPHPLSTEAWSPLVREYHHGDQDSDHEEGSSKSAHSLGLRSDAEAAEAFTGAEVDDDDSSEDEMTFFFDANEESDQDQEDRRRTVIGPSQVFPSQRSDGENGSESDGFSLISADSAVNSQGQSGSDPHGAESRK